MFKYKSGKQNGQKDDSTGLAQEMEREPGVVYQSDEEPEIPGVLMEWNYRWRGVWILYVVAIVIVLLMLFVDYPLVSRWVPAGLTPWLKILSWILSLAAAGVLYLALTSKRRYVVTNDSLAVYRDKKGTPEEIYSVAWAELRSFSVLERALIFHRELNPSKLQGVIFPTEMKDQMILINIALQHRLDQVSPAGKIRFLWWTELWYFIMARFRRRIEPISGSRVPETAGESVVNYSPPWTARQFLVPLFLIVILFLLFRSPSLTSAHLLIASIIIFIAIVQAISSNISVITIDGDKKKISWRMAFGRLIEKDFEDVAVLKMRRRQIPWPRWELLLEFKDLSRISIAANIRLHSVQKEGARLQHIINCEFKPAGIL
jgi:hypothetical protein